MAKVILVIFKNATKAFILATTLAYVAASLTSYINPIYCSIFTFLALGFPFILLVMLLASVLAFFCFKKYAWIFFLLLLVGTKNIIATTGLHPFTKAFTQQKTKGTIRLLSWNVNDFINSQKKFDTTNSPRREILNYIKVSKADILCLQDYRDFFGKNKYYNNGMNDYFNNLEFIRDSLDYPYYYFSIDKDAGKYDIEYCGTIIFSKYPIVDTGRATYDSKDFPEHIAFADILIGQQKMRFYNTHLSSMQLTAERKNAGLDYTYIQDDTAILLNKGKLERIAVFDSFHVKQAQIVKQQLNKSVVPFVFCADLNSVPSSYVYHHISSGLQDAFLQKGFGWGPTYDGLSHTLRIDVTLLSPQLKVVQHYCPKFKASDHFPLVTDIALP
jgi:endonuclease/exonuclease/phosphatase family metal-dependent hydrolase